MSNLRAWLAEKSPEEIEHFLGESPRLLLDGGEIHKCCDLLSNYDFIEAKINHFLFGVQAAIEDYELIENEKLGNKQGYNPETLKDLKLIKEALRLSAHVLNQDTKQLPGQLTGRLLPFEEQVTIQKLFQQISQTEITWLRPLTASLTPPGNGLVRTLTGHTASVNAVSLSHDDKYIVSGSSDNTIKVWELVTGKEILTLTGHSDWVNAVSLSHDDKYIVSGSSDNTIKVWELITGKEIFALTGHRSSVNAIVLTPDGSKIVSASSDTSIRVWNLKSGEVLHTFVGHTASVQAMTIISHNNKSLLVSGSYNNIIKGWNLETGKEEFTLNDRDIICSILAISGKKILICGLHNGTITIWNIDTLKKERILEAHRNSVRAISITSDGKRIISVSDDKTLKIWKIETWENEAIIYNHTGSVLAVTATSDSKSIISGSGSNISHFSNDHTIKVWELEKFVNQELFDIYDSMKPSHSDSVELVAFTPNGEYLISAAKDDNIKLWNVQNWNNEYSFTGKSQSATTFGNYENYRVFEIKCIDAECTLHNISDSSPCLLATTYDGMLQIWSSGNECIKIWDAFGKKFIGSFTGESEIRCCAIITFDGVVIALGDASGRLHFLRLQGC
ncbi:WD40 repeat domain-containing protein [Calothrix sp. 336/3]|uniref:WD40 repeat domain-containing protein n=1 Tax=Calothrix sp. 336/3 TaxID=1337936 RepID=UPI00069C5B70|nr:WD40 repeat domain-containing protein [Calothrix sp. 336/3]